jgi:hypothetical protein
MKFAGSFVRIFQKVRDYFFEHVVGKWHGGVLEFVRLYPSRYLVSCRFAQHIVMASIYMVFSFFEVFDKQKSSSFLKSLG